jgi:hypothetical protein
MSEIHLKLADYLQQRGLTLDDLVEAVGTAIEPEIVYHLVEKGEEQRQIDLSALAAIMQALRKLMGFPVSIEDVMQFVPDLSPEEMNPQTNPWYEVDIYGEIPPYDWGDVDPMKDCKPVRYIPGVGIVIEDGDEQVEQSDDAKT